jgi:hypothetical protein
MPYTPKLEYGKGQVTSMINQVDIQEPQQRRAVPVAGIRAIGVLSSICFFLAVAGFGESGIVLQNANGAQALLVVGFIGLGSSTLIALLCAASVSIILFSLVRSAMTRK